MPRHATSARGPLRVKRAHKANDGATPRIQELDARAHAVRRQHPSWTWADALRVAGDQMRELGSR